ncbi:lipoyl synthase [Candidatus Neomarinimicrobiota bacterium]
MTNQLSLAQPRLVPKPDWMKIKVTTGSNYRDLKDLVANDRLHTVCEEAQCPNIYDCWERRSATLMILGDVCTRSCGFCAVKTGRPPIYDEKEPFRVAEAVKAMGLRHAVITSVDRDELPDGGAFIWAETIRQIHQLVPECTIEVLVPDFKGIERDIQTVIDAEPEIFAHNLETIPRLYPSVRPQANYRQSLNVLSYAHDQGMRVKAGIMVGIGETEKEVLSLLADAVETGCTIFTIGQYLQPTRSHLPVDRYVHPNEFARYKKIGLDLGFKVVESGPLVRSSYHADERAAPLEISAQV